MEIISDLLLGTETSGAPKMGAIQIPSNALGADCGLLLCEYGTSQA